MRGETSSIVGNIRDNVTAQHNKIFNKVLVVFRHFNAEFKISASSTDDGHL